MADAAVSIRGVQWRPKIGTFSFGPLDAQAQLGRFIALVGPNGAGKSTLLKLAAGLLDPVDGSVRIFGKAPSEWQPLERGRRMSFLSQELERPFGFPVKDYVALGRFPRTGPFKRGSSEDEEAVDRELAAWGLNHLAQRGVNTLSGGEFQRVRLARSLAQEPDLLLFDEPGNHLDLSSRMGILNRLKSEAGSGRCIMAVLHDVNDALLYADEAWLIAEGRIVSAGKPDEILSPDALEGIYGLKLTSFTDDRGLRMLGVPAGGSSWNGDDQ